ncbi:hypothetical protein FGA82_28100 [Pseudomonas fluorescens]|nr:hypothetical protein FGA82_28100 [Pseudomonas fluorescens]
MATKESPSTQSRSVRCSWCQTLHLAQMSSCTLMHLRR